MGLDEIVIWTAIAVFAGFIVRSVLNAEPFLGLFGDFAIGVLGAFAAGFVFRELGRVHIASWLYLELDLDRATAIWLDVLIVSLIGAFVIRVLMRIFGPKPKQGG